jgi:ADP-ribose pyrophosphatase YjhB (NUDIX family)
MEPEAAVDIPEAAEATVASEAAEDMDLSVEAVDQAMVLETPAEDTVEPVVASVDTVEPVVASVA